MWWWDQELESYRTHRSLCNFWTCVLPKILYRSWTRLVLYPKLPQKPFNKQIDFYASPRVSHITFMFATNKHFPLEASCLHHLMNVWFWRIDGINYFHFTEEASLVLLDVEHFSQHIKKSSMKKKIFISTFYFAIKKALEHYFSLLMLERRKLLFQPSCLILLYAARSTRWMLTKQQLKRRLSQREKICSLFCRKCTWKLFIATFSLCR